MSKKKRGKKRKSQTKASHRYKWPLAFILLAALISFYPSLDNEFVNWDDDRNLYENEAVLNLDWDNTLKIFQEDVIGNYNPLSNFALAVQHSLLEGSEYYHAGFHLTNILLHLLCVALVYFIQLKLGFSRPTTIIATLLFAIHPMRVESVTWVTEIKDVLYASFYFGGIYTYLVYLDTRKKLPLILTWLLFIIGLFAKIQMVIFPLALILIDYLKGKNNIFQNALQKWYYFIPSLVFGIIGVFLLDTKGSLESATTYNGFERIFIGTYSLIVYLIKSVIPYRLSPLYPYPGTLSFWHYLSVIPALGFLGLTYRAWLKGNKILFFGLAFFFVNIVMLLQILGAGQGYLADRFTYVAYLGLFLVYAHYISKLFKKPRLKPAILVTTAAVVFIYAFMTFNQTKIWKNSGTLWTHVLKYYDNSTLPYGNRANYYRDQGQVDLALADYSSTIRLKPDNPKPYNSRAKLYFSKNEDAKALEDYIKAINLDPDNAEYLINRGAAYAKLGDWNKALEDLNKGLALNPNNKNGYLNRSLVFQRFGRHEQTLDDLDSYLQLNPDNGNIWYEKGRIHRIMQQPEQALAAYSRAISIQPQGTFYIERSKVYLGLNRKTECRKDILSAQKLGVRPNPEYLNILRDNNIM